ncbi:KpsF/GutQ family sugar-phosphate isomerase [Pelagibaculum spongiae]|uniref:Arabinose 5-phosphate isomerase n=1 Tax=Pelagibaculum spongiae TaxID=2080658 RepID=A0A2V1H3W7_9GAMM|nr:KpsF/GutQ family sugar-phosphate isomerase [Pelagibaculum spongiae]PVZ71918.1 D-arabinose 5-phosphate isomerase [Pelagibaculum spongiae]
MTQQEQFLALGLAVIRTETDAIAALQSRIDQDFGKACQIMLECKGRVVVTGMGKSGHIGGKIAATLASTGTPAFFVHPGEASHGDLGMITRQDVVLALSNSGETSEVITLLPLIQRMNIPLISMTGRPESTLSRRASVNLNVAVEKEACPLGLAPTSSTTATLVMGDALAVALLEAKGFTEEDFAFSHPGGSLGRRLLVKVSDLMHTGERIPSVPEDASLKYAVMEMTSKGLGMTAVVDGKNRVLGILTDGDLRRMLDDQLSLSNTQVSEIMTPNCKTLDAEDLAASALQLMEQHKINSFLVTDQQKQLVGALNMHDLLRAGVA